MKNILVPVGSSKNAKSHLQYAVDFAKEFGAKVYVVQIYNVYTKAGTMIKIDHILERESQTFLDEHVASIDKKGVEVITRVFKGKLIDTIELAAKALDVNLIVLEPRTNSVNDDVYLGKTSGKIVKQTQIPALVVPEGYVYKPIDSIMMAVKSAILKREDALRPLRAIKNHFSSKLNLLLVKTPNHTPSDFEIDDELKTLIDKKIESKNATTYQGVLEHFKALNPDLLCVVRRKRGFFQKLWEENTVMRKDFYISEVPVLILRGLK
ncbi:universal stress protein [Winogradskyella litorisediminis]|uniref:Universal stress protein n=1 Tax=Winogradskyella litorisediminis TaxID=1156618 RepID=A0ABW3N5G3_9FLAO